MINREGTEEKSSSVVTFPSGPAGDRESDGGDDLSHYSSCGGESEFERYCSASSAMGTPSFRGSSFQDSDFGSWKSFKLGGENTDFKSIGHERVLSGYHKSECCDDEKGNGMLDLNGRMEGFVVGGVNLRGNEDYVEKGNNEGNLRIPGDKGYRESEIDRCEDRNISDEGEASSRCEHSEGEDSMFGFGSDDDRKIDLYYEKNVPFRGVESRIKENQLVMNSAVAFGSDDWDDFVQESSEDAVGLMSWGESQAKIPTVSQSGTRSSSFTAGNPVTNPNLVLDAPKDIARTTPTACNQVEDGGKLAEKNVNLVKLDPRSEIAKGVLLPSNQVSDIDELVEYIGNSCVHNIFQTDKDPSKEPATAKEEIKIGKTESEVKNEDVRSTSEIMSINQDMVFQKRDLEETNIEFNPLSDSVINRNDVVPLKGKETKLFEDNSSSELPSLAATDRSATTKNDFSSSFDQIENHFTPFKTSGVELNDFYDEIVNDMEDILLESVESPMSRFTCGPRINPSHFPRPSRDGGSSASTSGTNYAYNWIQQPLEIDRVEVVGATQRKGDVSFSERLVGVQKYTVYKIRVWNGQDHWEVERRYRDFNTLYHRLKKLFSDNGWCLPSSWSSVERESRKLFGNASSEVIAERSILIQECLQSVIHHRYPSSILNALTNFLSPSDAVPDSPASGTSVSPSTLANRGSEIEKLSTLGKTISLVVEIRPLRSMKQMLDEQHYRCAGCHRNFDDGRTRMQEFVHTLGWGKPRLCEYSGQLFCSSCHTNDTAILPARVLHNWDFTRYPVSQMAKSFLDSINDQPMLCVSAVSPFLFTKVPTLQHVANIRNRIRAVLPYVRCPFRRSINKGLGSRRYLLDRNDFFALKDLIDLSKGVFSALPVMVETISRKIELHITDQCLICYDVGIPCSARQDCQDPLSLIFPFQAKETKKCRSCASVFHKNCFKKLATCPCGVRFKLETTPRISDEGNRSVDSNLNVVGGTVEPSTGLLSGLFSKMMPTRAPVPNKQEPEGFNNVISMGSLPNTSL
ncbi:hypothetical protein ACS0TY_035637 [Phlomoides rotata]